MMQFVLKFDKNINMNFTELAYFPYLYLSEQLDLLTIVVNSAYESVRDGLEGVLEYCLCEFHVPFVRVLGSFAVD